MRAKNFVVNRGISCVNRGISCVNRGVSCFIRCILSCFIRCNPVFQSWSSRRERVKYGDKIFRQIIGIPMGTDCAPDLANLFLFAYEYKYIMDLIDKGKSDELRLFRFVHRYIDDLIILNSRVSKRQIKAK